MRDFTTKQSRDLLKYVFAVLDNTRICCDNYTGFDVQSAYYERLNRFGVVNNLLSALANSLFMPK